MIQIGNPAKKLNREIPLNKYSREIIHKYRQDTGQNYQLFPAYSTVSINRLIKRAGKEAGISEQIEIKVYSGKSIQRKRIPKWQILSTKSATNTFIMNAFRLEIPLQLIMDYCGIGTMISMEKYEAEYKKIKKSEIQKIDHLAG